MENNTKTGNNYEYLKDTIEFAKAINAKVFSKEEQEQANIVIRDFESIESSKPKIHIYKHFTDEDITKMFLTCLNTYSYFDDEFLIDIIKDYLNNISLVDGEYFDDSLFKIIYSTTLENNTPFKEPKAIIIPSILNANTAGHHMVNQIAQILKNNSFQEQQLFMTYDDTVPTLLEMISAYESSPIETIEVFRKKRDFISKTIKIYKNYLQKLEEAPQEEKEQYKILLANAGKYLTSFYYAISLFHEYLEKPFTILEDVYEVLDCEATSYDLITDHKNNTSYEKGLAKFKSIIS